MVWKFQDCTCSSKKYKKLTVVQRLADYDKKVPFHRTDCPACPPVVCKFATDKKGCKKGYGYACCIWCGEHRTRDCLECVPVNCGMRDWNECPNLVWASPNETPPTAVGYISKKFRKTCEKAGLKAEEIARLYVG